MITEKVTELIQSTLATNSSLSYCETLVREHDPDRFMISMFLPKDMREDVWTLLAFNFEIARIREVVSEQALGLMRLQWWRDEIDKIYLGQDVTGHEVLVSIVDVIRKHDLDQGNFEALFDARSLDLEAVVQPENLEGLMNYAEFTTRPLYEMVLSVCGTDPALEILQPVVINYALIGIMRVSALWVKQGRCLFPVDLMQKHGLTQNDVLSPDNRESLKAMVCEIIEEGCLTPVGTGQVVLRASEVLSAIYCKQIKKAKYDITSPILMREPAFKALRVFFGVKVF